MLSLVLPTYNESGNLEPLLREVSSALSDLRYEVIVVDDDSPDGTWKLAGELTGTYPLRVIRRTGERGLATAVVAGFDVAEGDVLAVMDADRQYEAALLVRLYHDIRSGSTVAVGSRYAAGGSVEGWYASRRFISAAATLLARLASGTRVRDPLSGYFAVSRSAYAEVRDRLRPSGFKILLELLAALPAGARVTEQPLTFHVRESGSSKLSLRVQMQFLAQALRLLFRRVFR